jgi:hypothetical protein
MKIQALLLFLVISLSSFSQETQKRILFRGDSLWYAAQEQVLFSSADQGVNWDTIFYKKNQVGFLFFNGVFDTATNIYIADQLTIFVFGWDGTMLYTTVISSSFDGGKTWKRDPLVANNGLVGIKYMYQASPGNYFIYLREGDYAVINNSEKRWQLKKMPKQFHCYQETVSVNKAGEIRVKCFADKKCTQPVLLISKDGGATWISDH